MSEIDPRADAPLVDWSELDVSGLLPTGTVTLLLADVEGSTRLWETQPEQMTAAIAMKVTTPARPSTAPHDCAISGTAAKPCFRASLKH
jgi:class 3 adenylate cyclase